MIKPGLDRLDLFSIGLLVLAFTLVAVAPFGPKALGDLDFHSEAKRLSAALTGSGPISGVSISRAPGPVLFYAVPYMFVGAHDADGRYWLAGVLWTATWMLVALCLVRRVARRLASELAGKIAVVLTLASPFSVYYSLGILAEGPAYLAASWFLFGWAESLAAENAGRVWPRAVMTLGLTLLILCRPNAALILPMGGLAWLVLRRQYPNAADVARAAIGGAGLAVVTTTMMLSLQPGRSDGRQSGYFWETTVQGRFQYRTETWDWRFWDSITRAGSRDFENFESTIAELKRQTAQDGTSLTAATRDWVINDTVSHPLVSLKMALVRVLTMHLSFVNSKPPSAFRVGPIPGPVVYWTFHVVVNVIGLGITTMALGFLWTRRGGLAAFWPLWAPWLALVGFHSVVYAEPRYLLPAKCCQVIMAACYLSQRILDAYVKKGVVPPLWDGEAPSV